MEIPFSDFGVTSANSPLSGFVIQSNIADTQSVVYIDDISVSIEPLHITGDILEISLQLCNKMYERISFRSRERDYIGDSVATL